MSDESPLRQAQGLERPERVETAKPELTEDQIVVLYEGRLKQAILVHMLILVGGLALAVALFIVVKDPMWLRLLLVVLTFLASGFAQRLVVLRVKCPACDARVLGRIHSIIQASGVMRCPRCEVKLRR